MVNSPAICYLPQRVQSRYMDVPICMLLFGHLLTVAKYSAQIYREIAKQRITASLESSPALWLPSQEI